MSSANSMTREELLENAALDAFGLLDEYEASLYTRSFHNAPAAIQDQIIQLQAQIVSDETFLPTDSPDPTLRNRVLHAVTSAIELETAQLEPLATIGRGRGNAAEVAGRIHMNTNQFWRAASFALCAGLIVVSYFLAQMAAQHNEIALIALQRNTDAQLEKLIGPTLKDYLFDPTAKAITLKSANSDNGPRAVLITIENSDKAFLVVEGLAQTAQPYSLSVRHSDGRVETIQTFESSGGLMGLHVAMKDAASLKNVTWQISGPGGEVLASI